MTDINLKDFDKKNWDEFVHLRALQDVINQENAVNNEQNQQITQNTNDIATAKQEAEDAKNTAESAENTANEAKTTADGLSDKVDTAQSTAEDAKSVADEAKTSADNAGKISGMAQNTATLLGSQVSQLDNEVLKKQTDAQEFFDTMEATEMNGKNVVSAKSENCNLYNIYTTTGKLIQCFSGSVDFNSDSDLSQSSAMQIGVSISLPSLGWLGGIVSITDSQNNIVSFNGGIQVNDFGFRINFDNIQTKINALVAPYHIVVNVNQQSVSKK